MTSASAWTAKVGPWIISWLNHGARLPESCPKIGVEIKIDVLQKLYSITVVTQEIAE